MSFGASLTRVVESSDYVVGVVAPAPKPTPAPRPARSRLLHAVGYCMSCRAQVGRRNVRLVSLANGAPATLGSCAKAGCGQTVYRMGGYIELDVIEEMNSIIQMGYAFSYLLPTVVDWRDAWGKMKVACDLPGCDTFAARRGSTRFLPGSASITTRRLSSGTARRLPAPPSGRPRRSRLAVGAGRDCPPIC